MYGFGTRLKIPLDATVAIVTARKYECCCTVPALH